MDDKLVQALEFRIYRFSVNVFSFAKTLIDRKLSSQYSQELLNKANDLYSSYVTMLESMGDSESLPGVSSIVKKSEECVAIFQKIELSGSILNEKVDLAIEAYEISKKLKELI